MQKHSRMDKNSIISPSPILFSPSFGRGWGVSGLRCGFFLILLPSGIEFPYIYFQLGFFCFKEVLLFGASHLRVRDIARRPSATSQQQRFTLS